MPPLSSLPEYAAEPKKITPGPKSFSTMVSVAFESPSPDAPVGKESRSETVSLNSLSASSMIGTSNERCRTPGGKVSVPATGK